MKAKTIQANTAEEIQFELEKSMSDGFCPTLAIVIVPVNQDWKIVRKLLDDQKISVFGVMNDTQFTDEGIQKNAIVMLLLDLNPTFFKVIVLDVEPENAHSSGSQIAKVGLESFDNPAFILSAAHVENPFEIFIDGIVSTAGAEIMLAGGVSGNFLTFEGTVFTNDQHTHKGMISLILDRDKVAVAGIAVSGWKPIGTEKKITKCVGPWIHTIDNKPAFDVLLKYIGDDIYDDTSEADIVRLNTNYPLQVNRQAGSPTMCPALFLNTKEKSILCGGAIAEGNTFRFSLPPDLDVIETVVESSGAVKDNEMPEIDALLVFSCVGRLESLGPMINKELEGLAETWNKPMIGFFCMGEFGRVSGGIPEFHGTTCSWVVLKEK